MTEQKLGDSAEKRKIVVHVLASCRKKELLANTLLVFKTIRVGFPTAQIAIWWNSELKFSDHIKEKDYSWRVEGPLRTHEKLLQEVLESDVLAFPEAIHIIIDSDMVFFDSCETTEFLDSIKTPIAGLYQPRYYNVVSKAISLDRIHTSFLVIKDAARLKQAFLDYEDKKPTLDSVMDMGNHGLINALTFYHKGERFQYDTLAQLYHFDRSLFQSFSWFHKRRYAHLHCGTYLDLLDCKLEEPRRIAMNMLYNQVTTLGNLDAARNIHELQDRYFEEQRQTADVMLRGVKGGLAFNNL